jgi:hypothetical protein
MEIPHRDGVDKAIMPRMGTPRESPRLYLPVAVACALSMTRADSGSFPRFVGQRADAFRPFGNFWTRCHPVQKT